MFKPVPTGERTRYSYARINEILAMPHLIDIQRNSYEWFIRGGGLKEVFDDISPIKDFTGALELYFRNFYLGEPKCDVEVCKERDITYSAPLHVDAQLLHKETGEIKESRVFIGDFPLMTDTGTFVINGAERVIVSQLVRAPGAYYGLSKETTGKDLFTGQVIPNRGAWIEYETDINKVIYVRLDRTRKLPATCLLRIMGLPSDAAIYSCFGEDEEALNATLEKENTGHNREQALLEIFKKLRPGDPTVVDNADQLLKNTFFDNRRYDLASVGRFKLNKKLGWAKRLYGQELAEAITCGGKVVLEAGTLVDDKAIEKLRQSGVFTLTEEEQQKLVDLTKNLISKGSTGKYEMGDDVTTVGYGTAFINYEGRKMRLLFLKDIPAKIRVIIPADVIVSFNYLLNLMGGLGGKDDIDHLGNRRVRCVGELLQNQFRIGMARVERTVKERMAGQDAGSITPAGLINNIRPIVSAIREFFGSSQLSQFMDQNNPLAELTHKRRLSALGPGGLSRERAGYEVRDVHNSHYGRMCPIETPEGPNIGLIGSLSSYAKINKYGFIETPYRKVDKEKGRVTDKIDYLAADDEDAFIVAQANEPLDEEGYFLNERVTARYKDEILTISGARCDYMDVSPKQVVSIATALIPFLQNDDANRALMGANMQRQAVPLLTTQAPVVGTGMEYKVATDSGVCVLAKHAGTVKSVTGDKIVVQTEGDDDIYHLLKFKRSNQGTCVNQRAIVKKGDVVKAKQVLADGPATDHGELALGHNVIVAYMPWEGYNYEDAVLLSEDLVKEDIFTSIHIEEYTCDCRNTKLGNEEFTRDIPNVSDEVLKNLDEGGVIRIGAEVRPGDILVGKVTPKGETDLTPEERLIRAIFSEKAREVRDSSLRVPHGEQGIIVSVQTLERNDENVELPNGVTKQVRVLIAQKRKISEGDKMAGRHGNKGVVSRVMPREDMPFLPNGDPVQIVLNPLGVPSRMNIGQVLEAHLGWAACALGMRLEAQDPNIAEELRKVGYDLDKYGMPRTINHAVPVAVPVFDGARDEDIADTMAIAGVQPNGKTRLYDGRTGEPFDNEVTVGCTYMLKLHHLVADKIHARSTGPYSLVTQQPLGGKAQFGGQRFGEMEVWALEAYGAAYTLQEILTVKSDDVVGRVKTYEAIVKGENIPEPGVPESFKVLVKELQSIALDIQVLDEDGEPVDLEDEDDGTVIETVEDVNETLRTNMVFDEEDDDDEDDEGDEDEDDGDDDDKDPLDGFSVIADIGNMDMLADDASEDVSSEQELDSEQKLDSEQELSSEQELDSEQELSSEQELDSEQELNSEQELDSEQELSSEQELGSEQELSSEQ